MGGSMMGGWTDGCMDGWMGGCIGTNIYRYVDTHILDT